LPSVGLGCRTRAGVTGFLMTGVVALSLPLMTLHNSSAVSANRVDLTTFDPQLDHYPIFNGGLAHFEWPLSHRMAHDT